MSMNEHIVSEAELARTTVVNSLLDDDTKRNLVTLITKSAMATNGITPEEKIQHLTECMASLASALAMYMSKSNSRIDSLEKSHFEEHPRNKLERIQKFEGELHDAEEYRNHVGIVPNIRISGECIADIIAGSKEYIDKKIEMFNLEERQLTIIDRIFDILMKPYIWIFGSIAICSPFAVDILSTVLQHFGK